ncbi:TPA: restriction endonuclease subunit S [Serratia marcescens]|uniref:Type I restriction system specificity protein n=1 Tax=Serratia marcescens SM39 TaxID=1334564 RepID=A0AAT9F5M1_SERMA|nr:restriction endonuclease subunit S [Serratia marcescens]BAO36762.1 putative type I restriction system specificity protein [Serratia marcescens SM39]BCZ39110.1 hypothetical protein SMGES_04360 [Serratia marcescens]BEN52458.1 hypothetical protein SMKC057_45700 [Serratia marcescens]HBI6269184.1 restriction endonuclease subunit S [Serratia marcescens]HBI6951646.1 restriction endonuclease subunit S [Serratia marcescens]
MASEWQDTTLGGLFKVIHGFAFKGEYFTEEPQKTILVTPGNFAIGGGFQDEKRKYYNGPVPENYVLEPGQIVVTMTDLSKESDTLGYAARIPNDSNIWLHNQRVGLLKFKPEIPTSPRFIEYLLRTHEYRSWIVGSATGTTVKHTSPGRIENFATRIPPIEEQRSIAHILGTLDDKIELNRRSNETLEGMVSALFKAWFVDFEPVRAKMEGRWQRGLSLPNLPAYLYDLFPDRLVDSELGQIPEGWTIGSFSDVVEIIGGGTPKTSVSEYWDGDIPWFSVVDTPASSDVFVVKTGKSITQTGLNESSARLINKGTTIISARGTVGNLAIAGCDMTFNQSCYALRGKNGSGNYFVFLSTKRMVEQLKAMSHGSVFSTITRQTFDAVLSVVPPESLLQQFERNAAGLFDAILGNVSDSRTLAQLRDTLLPKLISGELRVSDTEHIVGA